MVRRLDDSGRYPAVGTLLGEAAWAGTLSTGELADVFRSSLREEYADASDAEMGDALENVLDSMSAAEAFNFGSALSQIGKSASSLVLIRPSSRSSGRRHRSPAELRVPIRRPGGLRPGRRAR